ncbi:MAG: ceramidase domain-containing protein [Thioalkalivibrio sp.]|nr:ceramidase domain-containing protein [Thioalkalivibrio sp.]
MIRYCERTEPGWFAEPLNTVTGLAYLVASWQAWKQLEPARWQEEWDLHLLAGLIALVGVSSMLLHASGAAWLVWPAVTAVAAFAAAYWSAFLFRVPRFRLMGLAVTWLLTLGGLLLFYLLVPGAMAGSSLSYLPVLIALLAAIVLAGRVDRRLSRDLVLAAILFGFALVVRALDLVLCEWAVVGTHWLWHLLTAGLLFVLVDGLLRHVRLREAQDANDAG